MAPRLPRLPQLARGARALARRSCSSARDPEMELLKKESNKTRMAFESNVEQKLIQQDLKISNLETEIEIMKGNIEEQVDLYRKNQDISSEKIKSTIDDLQFSFAKGAVAIAGLTAAICSVMVNFSRLFRGESVEKISEDGPTSGTRAK